MLRHGVINITRIIIKEMTYIGELRTDVTSSELGNETFERHGAITSHIDGNAIDTIIYNMNISTTYEISIDVATSQGYSLTPALVFVTRQRKGKPLV